ncbi:MAG: phosphogluconate dehydrogenase (NAD(+)-dependent, decarboxylating) [Actinomycetota bacterium]
MRIGMIGLGRMGSNMTRRLLRDGHEVVAFDIDKDAVEEIAKEGATASGSPADLITNLDTPRVVWIMVPAGEITSRTIADLGDRLEEGDVIVDGGNSRFTDTMERAEALKEKGVSLVDAGTSGGVWGLEEGYSLMVGGAPEAVAVVEPIFETLAPPDGYAHVGPSGAGHYVKMVHNGIEYGLMQAYGEGLELLYRSDFDIDLGQVAGVWRNGSVVRSWLLDLIAKALEEDPHLESLSDHVEDSGEGRWTVQWAVENAVPAPAIAAALFARFASRQDASFAGKVIAALRKEFGGHAVQSIEESGPDD